MKFFLCLVLVAFLATAQSLTDEQKTNWKKWSDECQSETGVSTEAINKIRNNEFEAPDDKIKAQGLCFGKKAGLINASGEINVEAVKTKLRRIDNEDGVNQVINQCVVKQDTPEKTAFEVFKCIKINRPKFVPV